MTQKFGRSYTLTIYPIDGGDAIVIKLPFTLNFTVNRDIASTVNKMTVAIHNLSEEHRKRIYQDFNVLGIVNKQVNAAHNITLSLGYGTNQYQVFNGRMWLASSAREGTNIVTKIECIDDGYDLFSSYTNTTLAAGQTVSQVLAYLIAQFPNLKLGAIGSFPDVLPSPVVLNGYTWELLKKYTNFNVYVDNGRVFCLHPNEYVSSNISVVSDATGLLNTPRRGINNLSIDILMSPDINLNEQISLQSSVNPIYNGTYIATSLTHHGIISGAVSGDARTSLLLRAIGQYGVANMVQPS